MEQIVAPLSFSVELFVSGQKAASAIPAVSLSPRWHWLGHFRIGCFFCERSFAVSMDGSDLFEEVYQVMIHFLFFFDIKYNLADCPSLVRGTGHQSRPNVRSLRRNSCDCNGWLRFSVCRTHRLQLFTLAASCAYMFTQQRLLLCSC